MNKFNQWKYCGLIALLALSARAEPIITVYTTQMYPIQNAQLATHLYYLDQVENIEDTLSQHLSKDSAAAEKEILALIRSSEWKVREQQLKEQQLKEAYQGVISGWQNGIKKIPAVLFEEADIPSSLVYGMTDVQQAKQEWEHWIKQNGGMK